MKIIPCAGGSKHVGILNYDREAEETAVYSSCTLRELNSVVVYVISITVM